MNGTQLLSQPITIQGNHPTTFMKPPEPFRQ